MDIQTLIIRIPQSHTSFKDLVRTKLTDKELLRTLVMMEKEAGTKLQRQDSDARLNSRRDKLLESLKYSEMNGRLDDLMSSREAEFGQVFNSYNKSNCFKDGSAASVQEHDGKLHRTKEVSREVTESWQSFVKWLQSDDRLFWIRGKLGSGKSTLVNFIIQNKMTLELLCAWKQDTVILSHFFWKIGSSPQNTIKGLLCSLVYQSLRSNPPWMEQIWPHLESFPANESYDNWSVEDLESIFHMIQDKSAQPHCIFIDGLDEICDDDGVCKLLQSITKILNLPNVKVCVASRVEEPITSWVKEECGHSVLLEDLTRTDMRSFVQKELQSLDLGNPLTQAGLLKLADELVQKSKGVFLWLHLATQVLTTGAQGGDSEDRLLSRLDELPSELNQLYADLWQRANEETPQCRERAVRYLRYALQNSGPVPIFPEVGYPSGYPEVFQPVLFQVACAEDIDMQNILLTGAESILPTDVMRLCDRTKLDIQHRCAGLLRLRERGTRRQGRSMKIVGLANDLDIPESLDDMEPALFSRVVFIHRSAKDFLTDTEAGRGILNSTAVSESAVEVGLLKGLLCLLAFLRSECGLMGRSTSILYRIIKLWDSPTFRMTDEATSLLRTIQLLYDKHVFGADLPKWHPQAPFLSHLTDYTHFDEFVISSVAGEGSRTLATDVLRETFNPDDSLYYNRGRVPSAKLIQSLISLGADPYAYGVNRKLEMGRMVPFARQGTAFTNLLMFGIKSIDEGKHLSSNSARGLLKAAMHMGISCPDLSVKTLVVGRIKADGEARDLMNVTWLSPEPFVGDASPWLLFLVDLKFLLLRLLLGFHIDIVKHILADPSVGELIPKLRNPSAEIRFTMTRDQNSKAVICHRGPSGILASEVTECIFPSAPSPTGAFRQAQRKEKCKAAYDGIMRVAQDPGCEKLSLESAILSLADKGYGFCTLLSAGIFPPVPAVEEMEGYYPSYPVTVEQLRLAVSKSIDNETQTWHR